MNVAIVGSRDYTNYDEFKWFVETTLQTWRLDDIQVVTGGAKGADSMAEKWAIENNLAIKIFKPDWLKYGKAAGPLRNQQIVENSTHVIAFPSKSGKGTQDTIIRAKKLGIEIAIYLCQT